MTELRQEIDRALLVLEHEQRSSDRAAAAHHLVQLASEHEARWPEFRELLPRLVADRDGSVRRMAVTLGALVVEPQAVESFLALRLKDPSPEVRVEAAGQLADLAPPTVRAALAPLLEDPAFPVRFEAARGIAAVGHPAGLEILVEALARADFRFRALGALAELGDARALPPVRKLFARWWLPAFERTQAAGVLAKLGEKDGAEYLLRRVAKKGGLDRAMAIELCGEVRAPGAAERLRAILADTKDLCRGAAARGLGRLKEPSALPVLTALLDDPRQSDELRLDAAEGLCLLELPEARTHVERALAAASPGEFRTELEHTLRMLLPEEPPSSAEPA